MAKATELFESVWLEHYPSLDLHTEYRFHPVRRWLFDYASLESRVAVEIEGGTWARGRHVQPRGYRKDCEKYNAAALLGWAVLRYTSEMVVDDPLGVVQEVARLVELRRQI